MGINISIYEHKCRVCEGTSFKKITFNSLLFPTSSSNTDLHVYENYLCENCSVVFQFPEIEDNILVAYYNNEYRKSPYALTINEQKIDLPIAIPWSGVSFQRFQSFHDLLEDVKKEHLDVLPTDTDTLIDVGAYQGFFLHAAQRVWNCKTIAYDYNKKGIEFAKNALGITEAHVAKNIYHDTFGEKARFVTLIHAFEHLREPNKFLLHLKNEVLEPNGYLYLEVPSLTGSPLCDPTHFLTYSPESLKFVLESNGFEVIKWLEHGKPETKNSIWENPHMNLSILAKSVQIDFQPSLPQFNANARLKELYSQHRRIIKTAVAKEIKSTLRSIVRSFYYASFVLFIERWSFNLAKNLKNYLRNLK